MKIKTIYNRIIKEEIDSEIYNLIKYHYNEDAIVMSKNENISFKNVSPEAQHVSQKPEGLWYGIGTNWIDWVKHNMKHWENQHFYNIELDKTKMYVINSRDDFNVFTEEFGVGPKKKDIDWVKVSKKYSGIEHNYLSYVSWDKYWDIESGCIWNKDAIINIEKLDNS
jgi:hypothetical protein